MRLMPKKVCFATNNRYDPITGCWNWTGALNNRGYGKMNYLGKNQYVHRISAHCYLNYDLKSRLHVLHRCDNPACFNPKHLFMGTRFDNMKDCVLKGRHRSSPKWSHCTKGHPMSGDNLHRTPTGRIYCQACSARRSREYRERMNAGIL